MKLFLINDKENIDISYISGSVSLNTSMDSLGATLTFSMARNFYDTSYYITEKIKVGDVILLLEDNYNLFRGVVVDINTSKFLKSIKCFDYCFYLNKNKLIKQFNEISASNAIEQLLNEINAPIGTIEKISTSITKIYNNNTVAEIIDDILNQVNNEIGIKYLLEFSSNKFNIMPFKKINVDFKYKYTSNENINESILEMKNIIVVSSNEQEETEILAIEKDEKNIEKYGSLQEVIQVDPDEDISKVRNIAKNKLKELNKVFKTVNIEGFATNDFKAGRVIKLQNKEFYLDGEYLIKNCTHSWKKGEHLVNIEVEEYEK